MKESSAASKVFSGGAWMAVMVGAILLAMYAFNPAAPALGDGNDSPPECDGGGNIVGSQSSPYTDPQGRTITGVCIKSGNESIGDDQHSGVISQNTTIEGCYIIAGIGTSTVSVTVVDDPDCKALSHIDVQVQLATPTGTSTTQPTATNTTQATATNTTQPTATNTTEPTATSTGIALTVEPTFTGTTGPTQTSTTVPPTSTGTVEPTVTGTVEPTATTQATSTREATATESAPTATGTLQALLPAATATSTAIVSEGGVQGGAARQEVAGVQQQQQVGGVTQLPRTGSGGARSDGWLLPAGIVLLGIGGGIFVTSRRMRA